MPNEFKVKNGLIVDRGGINITGSSSISGSLGINSSGSNLLTVDGVSGRLFTVDDSFTGSLFSVNTVAGLPIIEAFSDNTVRIGQHGQRAFFVSQSNVGFGKETSIGAKVDVSGSVLVTGSLSVTETIIVPAATGRIGVGVVSPTARLHITGSTTAQAIMRLTVGSAPTSPNDGDIWLESNTQTGLKIRLAGVTRTFTVT
jgi:hypothetical protein